MTTNHFLRRLTLCLGLVVSTTLATACGSDDGQSDQSASAPDLSAQPTNVRWKTISGGIKVPAADEGPADNLSHGAVAGFDHSPVGAGLAAMNQPTRAAVAPESDWAEAAAQGIAYGPGRDIYLASRAAVKATGKTNTEFVPTLVGWRITDYSDTAATVEVYATYKDESKSVNTYQMVWTADDWKVKLPDDGQGSVRAVKDFPTDMVEVTAK